MNMAFKAFSTESGTQHVFSNFFKIVITATATIVEFFNLLLWQGLWLSSRNLDKESLWNMLNHCACSGNDWRAFNVLGLKMSSQFPAGGGRGRNGYRMPFWPALTLFYPHFLKKALANSSETYPPPHSRCPGYVPESFKVTLILSLSFLPSTPPFIKLTKEELFPSWIPMNTLPCLSHY